MTTTVFRHVPGQHIAVNEPAGMTAEVELHIKATLTPDEAFRLGDAIIDASKAALNLNIIKSMAQVFPVALKDQR